ncbi:MAG: PH domain-containing protein [Balneolaceae bacterium]
MYDALNRQSKKSQSLHIAEFDPRIKSYILWGGSLILMFTVAGIILIPFWLIIGKSYINKYFDSLFCELTTRALHFKKGVWFQTERTIPLDKIQDLTFKEGPIARYFGLSTLYVETAGQSAQSAADLSLTGIVGARNFRERVLDQRDIVTDNQTNRITEPESTDQHILLPILTDIQKTLKSIDKKIKS